MWDTQAVFNCAFAPQPVRVYHKSLQTDRKTYRSWNWNEIDKRLKLKSCEKYHFYEVLRLLTNSYKHDFSTKPNWDLLNMLQLEPGVNYAPLPESDSLRKGLADFIGQATSLRGRTTGITGSLRCTGTFSPLMHVLNSNISIRNYKGYEQLA